MLLSAETRYGIEVTGKNYQHVCRYGKVVDHGLGPLKAVTTRLCVPVCANDVVSLKPVNAGRDTADIHTQTNTVDCAVCTVRTCGSSRCKTCRHTVQK